MLQIPEIFQKNPDFEKKLKEQEIKYSLFDRVLYSSNEHTEPTELNDIEELNKSLGFLVRGINLVFFSFQFSEKK